MARFTGKKAKSTPELNMGSMSDIIFMLLFFFLPLREDHPAAGQRSNQA